MIAEVSSAEPTADARTTNAGLTTTQVSVTWIDDGSENGFWGIDPDAVNVNDKVDLIVYTLSEKSAQGVKFLPPSGVLWISPPQPDNLAAETSEDGLQVFIADSNGTHGPLPQTFSFRLLAVYDGKTRISPDPTIINWEPS